MKDLEIGNQTLLVRTVNLLTFNNQPIKIKFTLFSIGVLFWFLMITLLSISSLFWVSYEIDKTIDIQLKQEFVVQLMIQKLGKINLDILNVRPEQTKEDNILNVKTALIRVEDVKSYFNALQRGGQIFDIQRPLGNLLKSYVIHPLSGDYELSYIEKILPLSKKLFDELDLFYFQMKKGENKLVDGSLLSKKQVVINLSKEVSQYSFQFLKQRFQSYQSGKEDLKTKLRTISIGILGIFIIATFLLILFTVRISKSMIVPVRSIVDQMNPSQSLTSRTRKIAITSRDEIGILSSSFNDLMESIHRMAIFKKVIEEDDSILDVYSRLGKVFKQDIGLEDFTIYEISAAKNQMERVYPLINADQELHCDEAIFDNCSLCRAKKTGHKVSSFLYRGICKQFRNEMGNEHICLPMIIGGSAGGVIQFYFDNPIENDQDELDAKIARAEKYIKESLSVIEAKRLLNTLEESAIKDAMTGLFNRRYLQEYVESIISGIKRRNKMIGLIMCDLDYFKQVNDTYGHEIGDKVLIECAKTLQNSVRSADIVLRFGGEEFLILLLDIEEGDTLEVAETIRKNVEKMTIKVPEGTLKKTISLGISEYPKDTEGFWEAIKFADIALYKAKDGGRNRSAQFEQSMWEHGEF